MFQMNPWPWSSRICALVFLSLFLLPGCFKLSRGTPEQQHFILGSGVEAVPTPVAPGALDSLVIGVRLPRLADYLASPFVVLRRGANRIEYSDLDRWGEDLARGISRNLIGVMSVLSPASRFEPAPWPPGARVNRILQLQVLRFEGVAPEGTGEAGGESHLLIRWEMFRVLDNSLLARGVTEIRTPGWTVGDVSLLVSLLEDGIGELARDILDEMGRIPNPDGTTSNP